MDYHPLVPHPWLARMRPLVPSVTVGERCGCLWQKKSHNFPQIRENPQKSAKIRDIRAKSTRKRFLTVQQTPSDHSAGPHHYVAGSGFKTVPNEHFVDIL